MGRPRVGLMGCAEERPEMYRKRETIEEKKEKMEADRNIKRLRAIRE